ncbi:MAG TPA: alpha-isopropylmalate synthase regulatory domain-containing protein, partial [Anaeromyxobacter sp.]|nr:alpha-isopropylmalate synthase regulatory domain-containing protein [Anaeromyxobacter sp.]
SRAAAFVEVAVEGAAGSRFGVGIHPNIVTASLLAVLSAIDRGYAEAGAELRSDIEARFAAAEGAA